MSAGTDVLSRVRCSQCRAANAVRIGPEKPVRTELGRAKCPSCGRDRSLRLVRPLTATVWKEPTRIGPHDEPADERDEADDVEMRRGMRAERSALR